MPGNFMDVMFHAFQMRAGHGELRIFFQNIITRGNDLFAGWKAKAVESMPFRVTG